MSEGPLVSVLMPAFNAAAFLGEAIESILSQSLQDFELWVLDDGSLDNTALVADEYARLDPRVTVCHEPHQGYVAMRNLGLSLASGKYIAWMDADDISEPTRLERLAGHLEADPEVSVCSSYFATFYDDSRSLKRHRFPLHHDEIYCRLLFENSVASAAAMMRTSAVMQWDLANETCPPHGADYVFWIRAAERGARFVALPEVLYRYRLHAHSLMAQEERALAATADIRRGPLRKLMVHFSAEDFRLHNLISDKRPIYTERELLTAAAWLQKLLGANGEKRVYPEPCFTQTVSKIWFETCNRSTSVGINAWSAYRASKMLRRWRPSPYQSARFSLKCLLKRGRKWG